MQALRKTMICVENLFSFWDTSHFTNVDLGLAVSDHSNNSSNMTWKNTNQDFSKTVLQNILKFCTITVYICRYNKMPKLSMVFTIRPTHYTGRHRGPLIFYILKTNGIYAEVVTFVAGSLEAGGLPGSLEIPEVLK